MSTRPTCRCHNRLMDWATDHWTCAEKRRARQLAFYHRKKTDPYYRMQRQLRDMTRVRIR